MDVIQQSIGHSKLDKQQVGETNSEDGPGHGSNSQTNPLICQHQQLRKLNFDLPRFDGIDTLWWIFSADQYFDYYHVDEAERINIGVMHMTSNAIPWFQLTQRNFPFRSWHELKRAIEIEFGPSLFESPR